MRKVVVGAFVSLDGVMQAPGAPQEDPSGGFRFGGWTVPYSEPATGAAISELFSAPFELLLGRRTYDIFAAHWPHVQSDPAGGDFNARNIDIARQFNAVTKHVATHRSESLTWQNSRALGADVPAAVRGLKQGTGPLLLTQGSTELVQLLLAHDLVDELRLLTYPVVLGRGKRLFQGTAAPGSFRVLRASVSPGGVVIATYARQGDVRTGSFALDRPSAAELERRKQWR